MSENTTENKQYSPQANKGALFPNKNKVGDTQPDYSGVLFIPEMGGKIDLFGYSNTTSKNHIDYVTLVSKEETIKGFLTRNPNFNPQKSGVPDYLGKISLEMHGIVEVSGWMGISKKTKEPYISLAIRHHIGAAEIEKWVEEMVATQINGRPSNANKSATSLIQAKPATYASEMPTTTQQSNTSPKTSNSQDALAALKKMKQKE